MTITGTDFTGATAVKFGTTAATGFTVNSATSITATAPAGAAGTVDVTVTTPGGTSATSAGRPLHLRRRPDGHLRQPRRTARRPAAPTVTITGTGFTGATAVKLRHDRGHRLHRRLGHRDHGHVPGRRAGTVDVTVTTPGGTSATSAADQFTYVAAPTVTVAQPDRRARPPAAPR